MDKQIYAVYSTQVDKDYLIAYVTCDNIEHIYTFFDKKKGYGLKLTPVEPMHISADIGNEITLLEKQKQDAINRLEAINKDLKKYGIS
jgi:hypothetical protein